jgi:conjugal transfer/entry exclusion protein
LLRHTQALLRKKDGIERNVRLLHYKLEQIDKDREEVFPELEHMPTHEFQGRAKKWNAALKESSTVAMRAQTSVAGLQERLEISTKLQRDSEAAEGIVGQLQLIVKSLALLHTDLSGIEQNLAYGQRVTATMAGVQSAEEERMTEEGSRMLNNYRYRGTEPRRLQALP